MKNKQMLFDVIDTQDKLNKLYINTFKYSNIDKLEDKDKLSAPLLIKVNSSYLNSKIKIMYIGKEVNHWLTHPSIDESKRGLIGTVTEKGLSLDRLLNRYDKRMTQQNNWEKSAIFKEYKKIKDQLVDNKIGSGSIVWNNLFKIAYDNKNGKTYSRSPKTHTSFNEIQKISKKVFLEELKILNPDILIFVTGSSYDKFIKDYLDSYETVKVIIPKKLWKFKYKTKICYRTVHPDSMRFIKKTEQIDYYQMIIDDIKKEI